MNFSYYNNVQDKKKRYDISLSEYIDKIKNGGDHDSFCFNARAKKNTDEFTYKQIKSNAPAIMGSCLMRAGAEDKKQNNIEKLNGLILLDVDAKDQVRNIDWERVKSDPYVHLLHRSFGGDGYVIFVKSSCKKPEKFKYYYNALTDYFFNGYGIISDPSCKNPNRLRYMSYDPEIYYKQTSLQWTNKEEPKKESVKKGYYFAGTSVIERLIDEINTRGINIAEDYDNFLKVGFALADEFGENGREYFHAITQHSNKYEYDAEDKKYTYILKSEGRGITIASLFYMIKEAGISIYSDRQKDIINLTTTAKKNSIKGIKDVSDKIAITTNLEPTNEELKMVETILNDNTDYSKSANEELSDTEVLENFIKDTYSLRLNEMTKNVEHSNGKRLTDRDFNTMYLTAKKTFDFTVFKGDVEAIIKSDAIDSYNPIDDFFKQTPKEELTGYIDKFIECIDTDKPEFAKKFFKKWIVSGVHNWTRDDFNTQVSPLTLVLCGSKHGTGKTSFFRSILPKELKKYYIESKLKGDDDSLLLMNSSMILLDDEFGGKAFKENKAFKELSDKNIITVRRKYERIADDFKRVTLLAGTTNEIEVLKDPTGNRRIIPINVNSINLEKLQKVDTKLMLWEAKQLLNKGFEWVIRTQEDMDEILANSSENVDESAEVEMVNALFSITPVEDQNWIECVMNKAEMLRLISEINQFYKFSKHAFNDWALKNKASYKNYYCPLLKKSKKGYKLFRNPLNATDITKLTTKEEDEDMPF